MWLLKTKIKVLKKSQKISGLKLFFDDLIERNDKGERKKKRIEKSLTNLKFNFLLFLKTKCSVSPTCRWSKEGFENNRSHARGAQKPTADTFLQDTTFSIQKSWRYRPTQSNTLLLVYTNSHTLTQTHRHTYTMWIQINWRRLFCFSSSSFEWWWWKRNALTRKDDDDDAFLTWKFLETIKIALTRTVTAFVVFSTTQINSSVDEGYWKRERQVVVGVRSTWMTANDCAATYLRSRLLFASEAQPGQGFIFRERWYT